MSITPFHLLLVNDATLWPVYVLAALTIVYVVFRPMLRRKKDPLQKLPNFSLAQQRTVEREMSNLLVELSEMSRQMSAQLDTRSTKLELLMQQADQRIAELRRLAQQAGAAPGNGRAEPDAAAVRVPDGAIGDADPRHAEIYALSDAGRTPQEIAQRMERPRGEVELILALRRRG